MAGAGPNTIYREAQLPADILERFREFRRNGKFCDVTLLVDGEEIHAHKAVLACCSPYFESVLKSHRVVEERLHVPVPGGNARAFQDIISFIYSGSLTIETNRLLDLLATANFLLMFRLKAFVADVVESTISAENVLQIRNAAIKFFLPRLHGAAVKFINVNFGEVTPALLQLDFADLEDLIVDESLEIDRGTELASMLVAWVCSRFKERFPLLRLALCHVDWTDFTPEQVVSLVIKRPQAKELLPTMLSAFEELKNNESSPPEVDMMAMRLNLERLAVDAAIGALALQDEGKPLESAEDDSDDESCTSNGGIHMEDLGGDTVDSEDNSMIGVRSDKGDIMIKCEHCAFAVRGSHAVSRITSHTAQVHDRQVNYKCFLCGFVCSWKRQFLDHLHETHFSGSPPYSCDACDHQLSNIPAFVRHRRKHLTDRPFHCDLCTYRCRFRAQLEVHCRLHKVDRPHICRWCRRAFATQIILDDHLRRDHPGERFLRCDRCSYRTRYPHHLATHRRVHSPLSGSLLRCSEPLCAYTTPSGRRLEQHIRRHFPSKTAKLCTDCGKTFLNRTQLLLHRKERHENGVPPTSSSAIAALSSSCVKDLPESQRSV